MPQGTITGENKRDEEGRLRNFRGMTYARRMIRQRPSLARQQTREAEERFSIHPESRNRLESTSHCNQTHENICNPFSRANFPLRPGPPVKNPRAPLVER